MLYPSLMLLLIAPLVHSTALNFDDGIKCGTEALRNKAIIDKQILTADLQTLIADIQNANLNQTSGPTMDTSNIAVNEQSYFSISYLSARICVQNPFLVDNLHVPKASLASGLQAWVSQCCPSDVTQGCIGGTNTFAGDTGKDVRMWIQQSQTDITACTDGANLAGIAGGLGAIGGLAITSGAIAGAQEYLKSLNTFLPDEAFEMVTQFELTAVAAFTDVQVNEIGSLARLAVFSGQQFETVLQNAGLEFSDEQLAKAKAIAQTAVDSGIAAAEAEAEADGAVAAGAAVEGIFDF